MATRRQYAGAAVQTTITSSLNASATSIDIASTTGWPSGATAYFVVISPGTTSEEKCLATRASSTLTLTRGQDGTTGQTHASGATIYPVFTATDADEANELASVMTTKGDIISRSSSVPTRLAVGTNGQVLVADSTTTTGLKWGLNVPQLAWESGEWFRMPIDALNHDNAIEDRVYFYPLFTPTQVTLDRLQIKSKTAAAGSPTVRLGLYSEANGKPSALIVDAGTVAITANETVYEVTINQTVGPGFFFTAAVQQGGTSNGSFYGPSATNINRSLPLSHRVRNVSGSAYDTLGYQSFGFYQDSVTGALPASATSGGYVQYEPSASPNLPSLIVHVRVA